MKISRQEYEAHLKRCGYIIDGDYAVLENARIYNPDTREWETGTRVERIFSDERSWFLRIVPEEERIAYLAGKEYA